MSPTYNKGEWSEAYVLVKVLADGSLAQGNGQLGAIGDKPYEVLSVLRHDEGGLEKHYLRDKECVHISFDGCDTVSIDLAKFEQSSELILKEIKEGKGRSFALSPVLWSLLNELCIKQIKAPSGDKTDIKVEIRDHFSGVQSILGFSIKSQLGGASTLVNASNTTRFRYRVSCSDEVAQQSQSIKRGKDTVRFLKGQGAEIQFSEVLNETYRNNLRLIDADLSLILGECLLEYYSSTGSLLTSVLTALDASNPCDFPNDQGTSFYDYKLKKYLTESALGMMPGTSWIGKHDATGGYIVVKESGELLSYHLLRKNLFEDYLLENTRFETASTTRHDFGGLSRDADGYFIDLNLQIRFLK
jgi:hypothetical protein